MTLNTSICKNKHKYINSYGEDKDSSYIMYLNKKICMGGQCQKSYEWVDLNEMKHPNLLKKLIKITRVVNLDTF